jgi:hypothetical protein
VFDNLVSAVSYPSGDSIYVNINGSVAPNGLLNGAQFNFIYLALLDPTGTAISGGALPSTLNFASFQANSFVGFNYGTQGVPYGAGNTTMIQFLSSLGRTSGGPATPPTVLTTALPNGVVGVPYSAAVNTSAPNGDPKSVGVAGLPNGLSFDGVNIVGTPLSVGISSVTITVTDTTTNLSTSSTLPLTINASAISFAPMLPNGVVNTAYTASFAAATGGTGPFTYSAVGLPAGLGLSGTTVSGLPTVAGSFPVTLTAQDSAGTSVSVALTLTINNPVPVSCSGTNAVISAYVPRNPGFIVVNGGLNLLDHLWTTLLNSGNTTFQGGLVNWFKTGLLVDYTGTVDPAGCILTKLTVRPAVTITTTYLPNGTAGVAYLAPVSISWGAAPYTVTVAGLPAGLGFDGLNVNGTPKAVGTFPVAITAIDAVGATATLNTTLTIADQTIGFAPTLPAGTVGAAYTATLAATGFGPFTFSAAGLPAGLTLTGNTISGTPMAAGAFAVTLTATDAAAVPVSVLATLTINPAPAGNYKIEDEGAGKITSIGADYILVGSKKLIWNAATLIKVNTPNGQINIITSFVKAGMRVQWKGLRDGATNTVLTSKLEIN